MFEFTSAVATGTHKALAGQLSPQAALDEVAKEWEDIVKRVGKKQYKMPMLLVLKWKIINFKTLKCMATIGGHTKLKFQIFII